MGFLGFDVFGVPIALPTEDGPKLEPRLLGGGDFDFDAGIIPPESLNLPCDHFPVPGDLEKIGGVAAVVRKPDSEMLNPKEFGFGEHAQFHPCTLGLIELLYDCGFLKDRHGWDNDGRMEIRVSGGDGATEELGVQPTNGVAGLCDDDLGGMVHGSDGKIKVGWLMPAVLMRRSWASKMCEVHGSQRGPPIVASHM